MAGSAGGEGGCGTVLGGPELVHSAFPAVLRVKKMRESPSACKELVNPGGSGWGWGVAPRPVFTALELSWLLAPGPALSLHVRVGDCCKSGI